MHPPPLDVLILADLHYTALARHACPLPGRQAPLALMLVKKALARLHARGVTPGLILLLGDLVEYAPTSQLFVTPRDQRTERYISGRFG